MRRWIRNNIPSMYHRRLTLLVGMMFLAALALVTQTANLTLVQGSERRRTAESVLSQWELIPTVRGRIVDRRERVLAADEPAYDVSVNFSVISGRWAYRQAVRDAFRTAGSRRWSEMSQEARAALIAEHQPAYEEQVQMLWAVLSDLGRVDQEQISERLQTITARVNQIASSHAVRRLRRLSAEFDGVTLSDAVETVYEETIAHPVVMDVDSMARAHIESFIAEANRLPMGAAVSDASDNDAVRVWREVRITPSKQRVYPLETISLSVDRSTLPSYLKNDQPLEVTVEGVGLQFLGTMRGLWAEDLQRRPYRRVNERNQSIIDLGGYLAGDLIGASGIEQSQEDRLRGLRGRVIRYMDSGEEDRLPPVAGRDVHLTIDIRLQARIMAIMQPSFGLMQRQVWHKSEKFGPVGEGLNGAAVVLEVDSGEMLAAVSVPHYSLRQLREEPRSIFEDQLNTPWVFRPVGAVHGGVYQPGSTIKPLIMAAAMTERRLSMGEPIVCDGHLDPGHPDRYRCWIYKTYGSTHGPLQGPEAMARSCNIFFYTLGRRMGARRVATWYDRFGLGHPLGCGLPEEAGGDLPDLALADTPRAPGFTPADAIFMAIGQGPVRWTPLQAANAYATLARGGVAVTPTILRNPNPSLAREGKDLGIAPGAIREVLQGLDEAVNRSYGTGHHLNIDGRRERTFNIDGVKVYGKSGTAQAVPITELDDDGRRRIVRHGDHAWFIGMVQKSGSRRPDYVVAVVVEFAGSGGQIAGPIANQILHALRAEGYL